MANAYIAWGHYSLTKAIAQRLASAEIRPLSYQDHAELVEMARELSDRTKIASLNASKLAYKQRQQEAKYA